MERGHRSEEDSFLGLALMSLLPAVSGRSVGFLSGQLLHLPPLLSQPVIVASQFPACFSSSGPGGQVGLLRPVGSASHLPPLPPNVVFNKICIILFTNETQKSEAGVKTW